MKSSRSDLHEKAEIPKLTNFVYPVFGYERHIQFLNWKKKILNNLFYFKTRISEFGDKIGLI